jgi:hypothetical protein
VTQPSHPGPAGMRSPVPTAGRCRRLAVRVLRWPRDSAHVVLVAAGEACLCLFGLAGSHRVPVVPGSVPARPVIAFAGIPLLIFGLTLTGKRADDFRELQARVETAERARAAAEDNLTTALDAGPALLELHLQALAAEVGLGTTGRISLYRVELGGFVRYGRFSADKELQSGGRVQMSRTDASMIAHALQANRPVRHYVDVSDRLSWEQDQFTRHDLPQTVAAKLRMMSAVYLLFPLVSKATSQVEAVLVLESTSNRGLNMAKAKEAVRPREDVLAMSVSAVGSAAAQVAGTGGGLVGSRP